MEWFKGMTGVLVGSLVAGGVVAVGAFAYAGSVGYQKRKLKNIAKAKAGTQ